jgi:uncharacterized protein (TIGR04255 family)
MEKSAIPWIASPFAVSVGTMSSPLPEFESPPLDEVAMGVQFEPLPSFRAAHLGLYWHRIRSRFPFTEDQPPLAHMAELEKPKPGPQVISVELRHGGAVLPRCWFLNDSKTELIQLQQDRFLRNWRQVEGNEKYPRFPALFQEFQEEWKGFGTFVQDEQIGPLTVNQCELTYVNNIERGAGWDDLGDFANVFTILRSLEPQVGLPASEGLSWQARYKLPEGRGRLHVQMNVVFLARTLKLAFQLSLTARGTPEGSSAEEIARWFDLAHEGTVRAFTDLTTPAMHKLWGRTK